MSQSLTIQKPFSNLPTVGNRASLKTLHVNKVVVFLLIHLALGLVMRRVQSLALIHVAITVVIGFWFAIDGKKNLLWVACAGAYITGAEVLWRMLQVPIPWEFGKYATSAIFLVAILRNQMFRLPPLALLFLLMLLISVPVTLTNAPYPDYIRGIISFYMSGPISLLFCAWFFYNVKLSQEQFHRLSLALIAPVLSIGAITLFSSVTTENIAFSAESNRITSGGFAPNQVSAVLGLGVFLALFCILGSKLPRRLRIILFVVTLFLGIQSAMTFSRGGLYMAAGATVAALFYLSRSRRQMITTVFIGLALFAVTKYVVLPRLDSFTDGALAERFEKTDLTGRDTLIRDELDLWTENPILGVGPGMGQYYRQSLWGGSHTEYTRLLSEHGVFGLLAIIFLLLALLRNLKQANTQMSKAVVAACGFWGLLFMSSAAMRLVAPSFMIGVTFITLLSNDDTRIKSLVRLRLRLLRQILINRRRRELIEST